MNNVIQTTILTNIFDVAHGNKFDLNKMTLTSDPDGAVAFVGRSGEGNGIVAFVEKLEGIEPYPAGAITVALGGSALASFVQPMPFYTAQNIDVLLPIGKMSLDEKLYYCLCIEANRFRYSTFGREANRTLKYLELPIFKKVPAWVNGTTVKAIKELNSDLLQAVK